MRRAIGRLLWWFMDGAHGGHVDLTDRLSREPARNRAQIAADDAKKAKWAREAHEERARARALFMAACERLGQDPLIVAGYPRYELLRLGFSESELLRG